MCDSGLVCPHGAFKEVLGDPLPNSKTIESAASIVAMQLARRMNGTTATTDQMSAGFLSRFVFAKTLDG
jgi:hypothetical protein